MDLIHLILISFYFYALFVCVYSYRLNLNLFRRSFSLFFIFNFLYLSNLEIRIYFDLLVFSLIVSVDLVSDIFQFDFR